jgi:hypothetical protein
MIKTLDRKKSSKITKESYDIIYWISSFLTLVFLIQLVIGTLVSMLAIGYLIFDRLIDGRSIKVIFSVYNLGYFLGIILNLLAFLIVLLVAKWSGKNNVNKIDKKRLFFTAGVYILIIYIINLLTSFFYMIVSMIQDNFNIYEYINYMPLFSILMNFLLPFIYLIVGVLLIKKSQYLASDIEINKEKVE